MATTADQYLEEVKRRVTLPANDELLGDQGLLGIGDGVVRDYLVPLILSVSENYFVTHTLIPTVVGQSHYDIPYRSLGRTLRDVKRVLNGDSGAVVDMAQVALEDEHRFARSGVPSMFYFEGDELVVVPEPVTDAYSLKVWYDLAPGRLVQTSEAAKVLSVTGAVVTIQGGIPSSWTPGTLVDFVRGKAGCRTLGMDAELTNVNFGTGQLTFGAGVVPEGLTAGDWVSPAGCSPVVQLPDEAVPLLVTKAASRVMHAVGDFEAEQRLDSSAAAQETSLLKLIAPRIEGEAKKLVNRQGLLRGHGRGRPFGRRGYGY